MYVELHCKTLCFCIYFVYTEIIELRFEYICMYISCTCYTHVCTWFIIVCSVQSFKMLFLSLLQASSTVNSPVTPSDKFMLAIYSAYRQESANRYIHCISVYVVPKNGWGIWSAFLCPFPVFVSIHHSAEFNTLQQLTYAFKRK